MRIFKILFLYAVVSRVLKYNERWKMTNTKINSNSLGAVDKNQFDRKRSSSHIFLHLFFCLSDFPEGGNFYLLPKNEKQKNIFYQHRLG